MSGPRDTTRPNWARTVKALRRDAAKLRDHDFQVIEPDNLDTPPSERHGRTPSQETGT